MIMGEGRTAKTVSNTSFGFLNRIINILMPFLARTVIIYVMGMEYAGLNSLFSSVLQVLNLAELGIGSAIVYCMYRPMAENDKELLCALLKYMRKIYFCIGCVVVGVSVLLIPFLSYFIKGSVPEDINIIVLYVIYVINTSIGYFFYSYKSTLLNAGQKIGIISKINSGIILAQGVIQILIVIVLKNYYLYIVVMPIFTAINNIWISYAVKKEYPDICCRNEISIQIKKDITMRVKGLLVSRLCVTTRNAFDSIFISAFMGLETVGIYGNYYYIMSSLTAILGVVTNAMTASVGNSLITESVKKNYNDMRKFNFIFVWIIGFCTCCLLTMYQPFMKIWMGENALLSNEVVVLMCCYFYFLNIGSIRAVYHDAAGLWWEARYRAVLESILNIGLNIFFTSLWGVLGTILGTLISLVLINYMYGTQIIFKFYFKEISPMQYFVENAIYGVVCLGGCFICNVILDFVGVTGLMEMFIAFVINILVFNGIYILIFCRTNIYRESMKFVKNIIGQIVKR